MLRSSYTFAPNASARDLDHRGKGSDMGRNVRYVAVAAMLLTVVGGLVAQAGTGVLDTPETIVLTVHEVKVVPINFGGDDSTPGNGAMLKYQVFDATDTTQVGTGHVQCTNQPGKSWAFCTGALIITVPEGSGQILAEGGTQNAPSIDLPVVGGTGDFTNAGGSVHIEFLNQRKATYTLNLLP